MQPCGVWTEDEARAVLSLPREAPLAAWRPAFSLAIKSVHPDHGGDADETRRVLEAYRYLKDLETRRHWPRGARPLDDRALHQLEISVEEAMVGVQRDVILKPGESYRVRLPAGLRGGDLVSFEPNGEQWCVHITDRPNARVRGSDLWLTAATTVSFLKRGGSLNVAMPGGERTLWVSRTAVAARLVEVEGAGLPAHGAYGAGKAFIRLVAIGEPRMRPRDPSAGRRFGGEQAVSRFALQRRRANI